MEKEREQHHKTKAEEILLQKAARDYENLEKKHQQEVNELMDKIDHYENKDNSVKTKSYAQVVGEKTFLLASNIDEDVSDQNILKNSSLDNAKYNVKRYNTTEKIKKNYLGILSNMLRVTSKQII